jgi:lysozyme family protein
VIGNFPKAWQFTAPEEGIHSDDPADPGGDTKYGTSRPNHPEITDAQWAVWTVEDSMRLAKTDYWDALGCDSLPTPVDIIAFDSAYNMGLGEARILLKEAAAAPRDDADEMLFYRIRDYSEKVRRNQALLKYFRGWINRVVDLFTEEIDK